MKLPLVVLSFATLMLVACATTPPGMAPMTARAAPVCPGQSGNCDMEVSIGMAINKVCKVSVDPDTFEIEAGTHANPHRVKLRWTLTRTTAMLGWEFADRGIEFIGASADFNDEGRSNGNRNYQFGNANTVPGNFPYKVSLVNPRFGMMTCTSDPTIVNQGSK